MPKVSRRTGLIPAKVAIGGCVALALCALSSCGRPTESESRSPDPQGADKYYDVAVGSFHHGLFEDAKIQLDRALQVDPQHPDSHYLRGVLLLNEGKSIVDAVEIEQCLVDEASRQQMSRAEELHAASADEFKAAVASYEEGAAGRGRAFNSLSVVSLFFARYEAAVVEAQAALAEQFYTDRYSALSNLGWAHYKLGDLVSATADLRQAVMVNPGYCVGHYRLAQVYLESGLVEEAERQAGLAVDDERCPIQDAHRIRGVANRRLERHDEAEASLRACIDAAPRSCLAADCERLLGLEIAHASSGGVATDQETAP